MSETGIGVVGCAGRMGRLNLATILACDDARLTGGAERPDSPWIGKDLASLIDGAPAGGGDTGLTVGADPGALFAASDVVVDFTTPRASLEHVDLAAESGTALVLGTTGLTADQREAIERAGRKAPIVQAANMSLGVNLLLILVEQAARTLGPDFDIEVLEMHHRHKVDAPSGTALVLGEAAAAGRGVRLDTVAQRVRDGHTGERRRGDIGFATLRGGDVAGEHTVLMAAPGERIELTHKATDRTIFSKGAIRAALWAAAQPPGLYSMRDVLGLG
jgi:4-hydroxy-tetrahydrodipicolinate reductase